MPRANWFFAFPIEGSFVTALPPLPPLFRLFHPEDVHLTLSFLGGCGEPAALRALAALDAALASGPPTALSVSLGKVVPMGSRPYSALSALLELGRVETTELIASLRDVLSEAALGRREKRAPKPHVTIARPSRRASKPALEAGLSWANGVDLGAIEARLDRIALYTWSEGGRRERLFRRVAERHLALPRPSPEAASPAASQASRDRLREDD
jgi:RNA 2',3'-cyclic 3'-phosphodiesterase